MKIKAIKTKDKNKAVFRVTGASGAYMNTLRRLVMNEVAVMAVEDVEFRKNTSILYDEMLAHRIGLVPLTTDPKSSLSDNKIGEVKMVLKAKADKEPVLVTTKDIKSKDKKVGPVYNDIPLAKLQEGQEIEAELTAILGQGKDHSKWSPCLAWFKHYPHVSIKKQPKNTEEVAKAYPHVFELKGGKLSVNEDGLVNHDLLDENLGELSGGSVVYEEKDDDFVFFIESWGQLDPKVLLEKAVDIHNEQLKEFKKLVKAM